jgi:SET domain-containing protein
LRTVGKFKAVMLLVKTKLSLSPIDGIGLFADEYITQGTVIWKYTPHVDVRYATEEYRQLRQQHNFEVLDKYIYKSRVSGLYVLCSDDARFINHASNPNTVDTLEEAEGLTLAAVDIPAGYEITSDYGTFDAEYDTYKHLLQ